MSVDDGESDDGPLTGMFDEPSGYFPPEKPFTFQTFTLDDGRRIQLRLVGHNPLWGHLLWNGARLLSRHLQDPSNATAHVTNRTILELGAGAGLPSLLCAILGAHRVVVTDYPDADLIANLHHNISLLPTSNRECIVAEGYLWGVATSSLLRHLPVDDGGFDTLLLADLLFNHSEHAKLVRSIRHLLKREAQARAFVFFTPYRPWLLEKDLAFFEMVERSNVVDRPDDDGLDLGQDMPGKLEVRKLFEEVLEEAMFVEDPGDDRLKRTVFGFELFWSDV